MVDSPPPARRWQARVLLSVVVPTHRRPALLERCLRALLTQRLIPACYEIIVVDDGRDSATQKLVEGLAAGAEPRLRYLAPAQGHGPAAARNTGWRAAQGTLLAFTDDDTVPDPNWLLYGYAAMAEHPCWAALSGRVLVPLDPAQGLPTDHERMTQGLESGEFVTANAFVRTQALRAIGGFDERFERAWREDSDLHFRLMREVGPVGSCADALVQRPLRAEGWGACLRQQKNALFDALLYKKHPVLYRQRIRAIPPWDDYLIVAATAAAPVFFWAGAAWLAWSAVALAFALVLALAVRRLRHTRRSPQHVWEMLATSALIPFLSVYWRWRGALRFRVLFL